MLKVMLAISFIAASAAPALAQAECEAQANEVWMAVQNSELDEAQKDQVRDHLETATAQGMAGDEETCLAMVEQLRLALGMEPEPSDDPGGQY